MKVVRKYYDLSQAKDEASRRRLEEGGNFEVPELITGEEQVEEEIAKLISESGQKGYFVPDERKKENFGLISRSALLLAQYLDLNVEIDTDNKKHSTIELSAGQIILLKEMGKIARDTIAMLFSTADEAWVDGDSHSVKLTFFYEVNKNLAEAEGNPAD